MNVNQFKKAIVEAGKVEGKIAMDRATVCILDNDGLLVSVGAISIGELEEVGLVVMLATSDNPHFDRINKESIKVYGLPAGNTGSKNAEA